MEAQFNENNYTYNQGDFQQYTPRIPDNAGTRTAMADAYYDAYEANPNLTQRQLNRINLYANDPSKIPFTRRPAQADPQEITNFLETNLTANDANPQFLKLVSSVLPVTYANVQRFADVNADLKDFIMDGFKKYTTKLGNSSIRITLKYLPKPSDATNQYEKVIYRTARRILKRINNIVGSKKMKADISLSQGYEKKKAYINTNRKYTSEYIGQKINQNIRNYGAFYPEQVKIIATRRANLGLQKARRKILTSISDTNDNYATQLNNPNLLANTETIHAQTGNIARPYRNVVREYARLRYDQNGQLVERALNPNQLRANQRYNVNPNVQNQFAANAQAGRIQRAVRNFIRRPRIVARAANEMEAENEPELGDQNAVQMVAENPV